MDPINQTPTNPQTAPMAPTMQQQPAYQPPVPTPPLEEPKKGSPTFLIVILIIILVAGALLGGYYLGQKTAVPSVVPEVTHMPTPTVATPTIMPSSPSGQLMYQDNKLGVSFSYPNTWEVAHIQSVDGYWLQLKPKSQPASASYSGPILISIAPHATNAQDILVKGVGSVTTQTTLAGIPAYQMTNPNCEPFMCSLAIAVIHNNTGYMLNNFKPLQDVPAPADQQTTFDLLVKTFAFTK